MTRLIASPPTPSFRRHSDPPKLWRWVLAGSFLFHLIVWITVRNFLANSVVQENATAIAVEFLEPLGADDGVSSSPTALAPSNSSQPSRPVEEDTTQPTRSTPAIPSDSISQIAPTQPITERSVSIPTPNAPTQPIAPKKTVPSSPVDTPQLTTPPKRTAIQTAPVPDDSALKEPLPVVSNTRLPDVPMVPNPTDAKDDSNREIASIPIPSSPAPAQFMAQFRVINSTSNLSNSDPEATISAQILDEPTKFFSSDSSSCTLTPKAFHGFGQPVMLQLPLNKTGIFDSQKLITVKQSSGNPQYDELATCVTKISRFIPAYKQTGDRKQAVSSDLEIQVTLIQ
ncbi:MAG: hypothetical protein DCF22_12515 [Leptolyngbya sp.]|nr:MAG: hypothetical protein DCF22_12515 [Leptolyngbya sp.]